MKVLLSPLVFVATTLALQNPYGLNYADNLGQYVHDDSGRYIPDDSGRYIPDHSGAYSPDGLGGYLGDGSGNYNADGSGVYKGDGNGNYRGGGSGTYNNGFGFGGKGSDRERVVVIKPQPNLNSIGFPNLLGSASNPTKQTVKPDVGYNTGKGHNAGSGHNIFGNIGSASTQVTLPTRNPHLSGNRYEAGRYADGRWNIIRQSGDIDTDGYHWEYETENGITAEESGKLANKGTDLEAMKAKGFYQYTGPDNVVYRVTYTADENGFIPEGNHIPTPPPIPSEIVKSLDFLKSIGKL